MATPSHRLKLKRAEKHLSDLKSLVGGIETRRPYPVRETISGERYDYTLELDEIVPDEWFPIILGDFLFNVRSALDHLMVSIAPRNRKGKTAFPIYTEDPLATDPISGGELNEDAARRWRTLTKGLPDDCLAVVKWLQPYESGPRDSRRPQENSIAVLNTLHNADKHRELVGIITGLNHAEIGVGGDWGASSLPVLKNGAHLFAAPFKVDVKIEGSALVGIGNGVDMYEFGQITTAIFDSVTRLVVPKLEPFIRR